MRPVALDEIVDVDVYESLREDYRALVREVKRARRLAVGDRVSVLFENRETVRFQVQEMLRVERIRTPARVQHELDVYNELVPGDGELSATLLIEITDTKQIRSELDRMLGIDACVFLVLGDGADALRIRARFDDRQLEADRISAVHYLRFEVSGDASARMRDDRVPARLAIEHAAYTASAELGPALRASLVADLAGDPAPLLTAPSGASVVETSAPSLTASGRVRVRRAEHPAGRGHVVIEPVEDVASSWLAVAPDLEAEILAEVKRRAAEIASRHGRCRVVCDVHAAPLRWHVFAPETP